MGCYYFLKDKFHIERNCRVSKTINEAGRQWLTPVILATQEAAIRRIGV
jgi:hypothetical protein